MNYNLEYIDIILLAMIAGFIVLRLRNILGRKTGHQGKPFNKFKSPIERNEEEEADSSFANRKVEFDDEQRKHFLKGAKIAYESIITSFASGDKKKLKPLLSDKVFSQFEKAIDERKKNKLKSELTFIGIKTAEIKTFDKKDNIYNVVVSFASEIISCLKDKDNKIVEGNPDTIKTVKDKWKFSRNMWSDNPTWYLVETLS